MPSNAIKRVVVPGGGFSANRGDGGLVLILKIFLNTLVLIWSLSNIENLLESL